LLRAGPSGHRTGLLQLNVADLAAVPEIGTGSSGVPLHRRLLAELVGSAFLLVAVVGSGIMASRLSPDDVGLQLFENSAATAGALIALILTFGGLSGAHFNPVVTIVDRIVGTTDTATAAAYVIVQTVGACCGTVLANLMFDSAAVSLSEEHRSSGGLWLSEVIATVGLLLVIHGCARSGRSASVPYAVGLWIGGAYWFTSSTSFANPAVTVARTLSDTFSGIEPSSAPMFVLMQLLGAAFALGLIRALGLDGATST
jgi:glycerol uptake facilitator-like aquaporin